MFLQFVGRDGDPVVGFAINVIVEGDGPTAKRGVGLVGVVVRTERLAGSDFCLRFDPAPLRESADDVFAPVAESLRACLPPLAELLRRVLRNVSKSTLVSLIDENPVE